MSKTIAALLSFALLAPLACTNGPDDGPPQTLDDIAIPEDFAFETKRPVALTVRASADVVQQGAAVEIARDDGRVLFKGPIVADRDLELKVAVPTKDRRVRVKIMNRETTRSAEIDIEGGEGAAEFE